MKKVLFWSVVLFLVLSVNAGAIILETHGLNDPDLNGAHFDGFEDLSPGATGNFGRGDYILSANHIHYSLTADNVYSGFYGTQGVYIHNAQGALHEFEFDFGIGLDLFAFSMGAVDNSWTLIVRDVNDNVILDTALPDPEPGTHEDYYLVFKREVDDPAMQTIKLVQQDVDDYVLIDNVRWNEYDENGGQTSVPEPTTLLLTLIGLGFLGGVRRGKEH